MTPEQVEAAMKAWIASFYKTRFPALRTHDNEQPDHERNT